MLFNLLENGYVTASGTMPFSLQTISEILSVSGTLTISGSNDDSFWIYGDIVDRIAVSQIRYYFDSSTSSGTVASGISFSYKNDATDSYSSLTTNIGDCYYYTTVPSPSAPRYIKLVHTVSGTSIEGTVVGLEVINDDTVVDFGANSNLTSDTTLTSLNYLNYNDYIKEIKVYNSGSSVANAHVYIDPQYSDVDTLLSISDSEDGPWVFARNTDYVIVDGNNWLGGRYDATYTVGYNNELDAVNKHYSITLTNNDLTAQSTYTNNKSVLAEQGVSIDMFLSKKWYWEIYIDNETGAGFIEIGIGPASLDVYAMLSGNSNTYHYKSNGNKCSSSSCTAYGDTFTNGDTIGVALDMDAGKIWFSKNGVWQASGDPVAGTNDAYSGIDLAYTYVPACGLYDSGDKITVNFTSTTYTPPEGFLIFEVLTTDGKLRLYSNALVGSYTTPIFRNDSAKYACIDLVATTSSGGILTVDAEDYTSTIEVRSSATKPRDYNVYRKLILVKTGTFTGAFYYIDYLIDSDIEIYDSYKRTGSYLTTVNLGSSQFRNNYTAIYINDVTAKSVIFESWSISSYGDTFIFFLNHLGYVISLLKLRDSNCGEMFVYFIEMDDVNDDFWIYMYSVSSLASIGYSSGGYYLFHFDSDLNRLYEEQSSTNFIVGCDMIKDGTGALWCSRADGANAIYKLSSSGDILLSYDNVTDVGRLTTALDGGCWFIDENSLYKLDSDGELEDSITNLDINYSLDWVVRDEVDSEFLWIVDGPYVKFISTDGRVYKSLYFENFTITKLYTTREYLVVYCTDIGTGELLTKFIGRASGGVDKTIINDEPVYDTYYASERGIKNISYDNITVGDAVPLENDPVWNDGLEWNKAVTNNAILPREEYNQLRLTLRRPNSGIDSPTVDNIYYQDSVTLTDIQPEQSKSIYLRISTPDNMSFSGDYMSNLRVWWEELIS